MFAVRRPKANAADLDVATLQLLSGLRAPRSSAGRAGDRCRPRPAAPSAAATPCGCPGPGRRARSALRLEHETLSTSQDHLLPPGRSPASEPPTFPGVLH